MLILRIAYVMSFIICLLSIGPMSILRNGHAAVSNLGVKGPGSSFKKLAVMPSTLDMTSL